MNAQAAAIQNHFLSSGSEWRLLTAAAIGSPNDEQRTLSVFINRYACCGVVAVDDAGSVQNLWKDWEQSLIQVHRRLRRTERSKARPDPQSSGSQSNTVSLSENTEHSVHDPSPRDLFLVMIVEKVPLTDSSVLAKVANDTFGSRKILVACEGRTIADTLGDLAFFSAREAAELTPDQTDDFQRPSQVGLDPSILQDLARRSPTVIFDWLLEGKYLPPRPL